MFFNDVPYFSCRIWKWAQTSWWTSWTESLQSVRCVCICHTYFRYAYDSILQNTYTFKGFFSFFLFFTNRFFCYVLDHDLKTDGFSIESCRSMVAVMDVSFPSLVLCVFYITWVTVLNCHWQQKFKKWCRTNRNRQLKWGYVGLTGPFIPVAY